MLNEKQLKRISKLMSLVLRHNPKALDIELDEHGWTDVALLIERINQRKGLKVDRSVLEDVVANNDKKRFSFSEDGLRIRANQGHSVQVDLEMQAVEPPEFLYHGTATRFLKPIMEQGLLKRNRQHVHMAADKATAVNVGSRHGVPVVLIVRSGQMHQDGHAFFLSANKVWLTDHVPAKYLDKQG